MSPLIPSCLLLGSTLALGLGAQTPARIGDITFRGGSGDDQVLARLALGLRTGDPWAPETWKKALVAVRATDRFKDVQGETQGMAEGMHLRIDLTPWPRTRSLRWEGVPKDFWSLRPREIRKGAPLGDLRLAESTLWFQGRLRAWGYPEATVTWRRFPEAGDVIITVQEGKPNLVRGLEFSGALGPYSQEALRSLSALRPNQSLWHQTTASEVLTRLRKRWVSDGYLEARATLDWRPQDGIVRAEVEVGPKVEVRLEGEGISGRRQDQLLPFTRTDRYSHDLLDEGERRLLRELYRLGHLDATVSHAREILEGTPQAPRRVRLTYRLQAGPTYVLTGFRVERTRDVPESALLKEISLPKRWVLFGHAKAAPDVFELLEERIKEAYWRRGFPEVQVQRMPLQKQGREATAVFRVEEGPQRLIRSLQLEVAHKDPLEGDTLAAGLGHYLVEGPILPAFQARRVLADRSTAPASEGFLKELPPPGHGVRRIALEFDRPVPLVKTDLARVITFLRQRLATQGIQAQTPLPQMALVEEDTGLVMRLSIPPLTPTTSQRLVVQGAGRTRAKALLREIALQPGTPLDPERITRTQSNLANLGGFDRVDVLPLREDPMTAPLFPWVEGDLAAKLVERAPWVFSHSFGYDKSQGYHLGLGAQRLNLGGMGRTLDFGIRAGDGTLQNPGLRRIFTTGPNPRSVDMYSIAYSDPWLSLGSGWLPSRSHYRAEAAYIHEQRETYIIQRRRLLNSLEWRTSSGAIFQGGLRVERVRVLSAIEGIQDKELNETVRIPGNTAIVAPWVQASRDQRDSPLDPTEGTFGVARLEMANQAWGTSPNASFVKLDLRHQWNWPVGYRASQGVLTFSLHLGAAVPTAASARDLPLSERFFAGGPFSHRGVEPDWLGPQGTIPVRETFHPYAQKVDAQGRPIFRPIPVGGQGLLLLNAEYRFPVLQKVIWGEVFLDSGMVQRTFYPAAGERRFTPLRTALGVGLIAKIGMPIKVEFAWDVNRLLGRPRDDSDRATELKSILLSAGFQF